MSDLRPRVPGRADRDRRLLRAVGLIVVATLLALIGGKLAVMNLANAKGMDELARGDFASAEGSFRVNLVANWISPWRAPYNLGTALYGQGKWVQAQEQFALALETAPSDKTCVVTLNLAWSHEAEGDQLESVGEAVAAIEAWRTAEALAKDAGCSGGEAEVGDTGGSAQQLQEDTEQRTQEKAESAEAQAAAEEAAGGQDGEGEDSQDARLEELTEANQSAQEAQQQGGPGGADGSGQGDPSGGQDGRPTW